MNSREMIVEATGSDWIEGIECGTVESDDRPASGLLRGQAFMAERFVRCPVDLRVKLKPGYRQVVAIDVGLKVGEQKSSGIEIYSLDKQDEALDNSRKIGVAFGSNEDGIEQYRFVERKYQTLLPPCLSKSSKTLFISKSFRLTSRYYVIRITRSHYIPSIRFIKIWLAQSRKASTRNYPQDISLASNFVQTNQIPEIDLTAEPESSEHVVTETAGSSVTQKNQPELNPVSIPEEFIDALTFHVMSLPVLLPSGHTIDRNSLDRYTEEQALLGRIPNDPFTGVAFSGENRPIPNSSLKNRLDKFWTDNAELAKLHKAGRTTCGNDFAVMSSSQNGSIESRKRNLAAMSRLLKGNNPDGPEKKISRTHGSMRELDSGQLISEKTADPLKSELSRLLGGRPSFL